MEQHKMICVLFSQIIIPILPQNLKIENPNIIQSVAILVVLCYNASKGA